MNHIKLIRNALVMGLLSLSQLEAQQPEAILQREDIRRQEILLKSNQELNRAIALINEGKIEEAEKILEEVLAIVPASGKGKSVHTKGSRVLAEINIKKGSNAAATGDWFTAKEFALKALNVTPGNPLAEALLIKSNDKLGVDKNGKINPAVDRRFVNKLGEITALKKLAADSEGTGQFDEASRALQKVLQIDPYNKEAANRLKKIQKKIKVPLNLDRLLVREELISQTKESWTEEIRIELESTSETTGVTPIRRSNEFAIQEKLRNIIIPSVSFQDATIEDATRFLTAKTRELDQDGTGISFLVRDKELTGESAPFSLTLQNVPASEVLRYITNLAGVKSKIEEFAVFIVPLSSNDEVLITRDFPVRASFFDVEASSTDNNNTDSRRRRSSGTNTRSAGRNEVRSALEARGVSFVDGATAIYNSATGTLSVNNTQDQIDLVEELVTENQGETLMVRVETKFIEINQTDLEELTPQFALQGSQVIIPGLPNNDIAAGSISLTNGLQGAASVSASDGVESILNQGSAGNPVTASAIANQVGITGALDGNRFASLINLISQKESTDIMTAPSVIINDGTKGSITVAREFQYPIEFDPAESQTGTVEIAGDAGDAIQTVIVPAFASEFETKNVGVRMEVEPRITVDRKRVLVRLQPDLIEFDGFVNYGQPIADVAGTVIAPNNIQVPVFTTRTVEQAEMEIQDGYTMVLGGLISDDINTVEEKVPFLGDLPLVGRAFQSKAELAIKTHLLIFVSVKILRPDGSSLNNDSVALN